MYKYFFSIITVLLVMSSCETRNIEAKESEKGYCVTDSIYQKLGIHTVKDSITENTVLLNGVVTIDQDHVNHVYPLVSGTIESVKVQLGDHVQKGQILAVGKSSELVGFSNDLIVAQTNVTVTKKQLDVTQELFKSGLASQPDIIAAQANYEQAQASLEKTHRLLAINEGNGKSETFTIKAPMDGYIVEKFITDNMKLRADNSSPLFTISDLKKVWVIGNAYESDISKIKVGDNATVKTLSYQDKIFQGVVDKIFNVLDPVNKVMQVRIQMANPGYLLKPQMYTSVMLSSAFDKISLPVIPSKAIIFDNSKNYVLVTKDRCNISIREITLGKTLGDMTFVKKGLSSGEQVLTMNQLYLYQALNMTNR